MSDTLDHLLQGLVGLSDEQFELELTEPVPVEIVNDIDSRQLDDLLSEGRGQGLIAGDRQEGMGSLCWWSGVHLTVEGLRRLGEWPPPDEEHLAGPWDDGVWGRVAKPKLAKLIESPPEHGYLFRAVGGGDDEDWRAALGLLEIGAIDGRPQTEGLADLRATARGAEIIDPPEDDPIERARLKLSQGSKADAMTAAVEEGLGPRLKALATKAGVDLHGSNGRALPLAQINDQLEAEGVYGDSDYKETWGEIAWILRVRNAANHGRGATLSTNRLRRAIDSAGELLSDVLPEPDHRGSRAATF